jgi:type I restriction enzyme S subunit
MLSHHFDKSMWERVDFGDVAENKNESSKNPALEGLTRVVGLDDMDSESLPLRGWSEIGDLPDGTTFTRKFSSGQVLFGKRRSYQKKVSVPDFDGVCSGDILVFEARNEKMLSNFLPLVVQSADFMSHAIATSAGSLSPRTKWSDLAKYQFDLPSLKDQEKIIEIISSIDKTIEAYQDLPLETQRESMLHELLSAGGDDWTVTTLGVVSLFISRRVLPNDVALETQYVGLEHVEPMTTLISTWGNVESVSSSVTPFEPEDTLFGRLRPYLHKVAFADFPGVCSPEILVLRSSAICEPRFLYLLCSLASTVKKCVAMSAGTRMPRTSAADLASIEVYLPPLDEQKRIVEIVSSMDEVIRATKQAIRDLKALRISLLTEILSVNDNG